MLRRGERTENDILEELSLRIKTLEDTVSRRALPPGYIFVVDQSTNQLLVKRLSDSATVVIL